MYMSEISKFKISDLKAQKLIILWTMKHVSAIRKHPVPCIKTFTVEKASHQTTLDKNLML